MNILVCIKQVPVVSALEFDPVTKTLKREGVRSEVSAFDVRALLKAVELRERHGGEVTALTMGPPQAREALVECLALGADRAVHLCDRAFAGADTLATAEALAAAIRRRPFDLIVCGRNSVDAETGQVGPEVAELLGVPQLTSVRALDVDPRTRTASAEREIDGGVEHVEAPLPLLVTAAEDLAPERFASKAERAAAEGKPIEALAAADLGLAADRIGATGSPTWVLGLSEFRVDRRGEMIDAADPRAAAASLAERLLDRGLFGSWKVDSAPDSDAELGRVPRSGEADVLVVAETDECGIKPVTFELLRKAADLASRLGGAVSCLLADGEDSRHVEDLSAHGAGTILLPNHRPLVAATEPYAELLERVITSRRPGVVLIPSTVLGRDVAPRVAARLRLGLTGDCIDLSLDEEGRLLQHKPAFGGTVVALIASRTRPEMATVRPGMLPAGEARAGRRADVVRFDGPAGEGRVRVVSRRSSAEAASALDHAEVVVGVGKGIGGPENLPLLRELADVMGGALCTTRDVTDAGWLAKQHQVGLTGRAIAPQLYLAVGVRGAFEHTVGIRRAAVVAAINKSPKAPIFKVCDYGVAADWAEVVPLLIDRLSEARKRTNR
jgi:electron transfer flavoprotein alpha subunit